jgi:hypothetical protein|nr:hypothetical protein [Ruminococcus bromii]
MKNKKIFISAILIVTMLFNVFPVSVYATEITSSLDPEQVVLIGDSKKFKEKRIRTDGIERQDIDLKVEEDISSADLDSATNIIVDKESYDELPNNEKRDIRKYLKDELVNNKRISFYGNNEGLNLSEICDTIDYNFPIIIETEYDENYNIFSYSFELDKDGNIKMTRLIDISGSAISEEEKLSKISNYQKPEEKIDQNYGIETQIVTGGNGAYTQTYTDLLINSKNCDTLLEVYFERVKKGKDYTKWYAEARTIIDPTYNKNQLQYACIALGSRNSLDIYSRVNNPNNDDEIVTNFSPKNANNKSSYTVGISADLGTDPKLGVDYQTQIDIQDCEIKVAGGNKYKIWGYCYKSNSALAKGSSEQMGAVIMKNTKSTFNAMVQVGVITDYTNKNQTVNKVGWNVAVDNIRLWTNRHIFTDIK